MEKREPGVNRLESLASKNRQQLTEDIVAAAVLGALGLLFLLPFLQLLGA